MDETVDSIQTDPPPTPAPQMVPRDGFTVSEEFPCSKCAYNLYKCRIDRPCPECGTPVRKSIPSVDEKVYFFKVDPVRKSPIAWIHFGADVTAALVCAVIAAVVRAMFLHTDDLYDTAWIMAIWGCLVLFSTFYYFLAAQLGQMTFPAMYIVSARELWICTNTKGKDKSDFLQKTRHYIQRTRLIRMAPGIGAYVWIGPFGFILIPATAEGFEPLMQHISTNCPVKPATWKWFFGARFAFVMAGYLLFLILLLVRRDRSV